MTANVSEPFRDDDHVGTIMVYTLQPCAPCEVVKEAVKLLEGEARNLGWKIQIVPAILGDKKSVGAAHLAGVKHFPTVKLVRDRRVVKTFASVRVGWTAQDVASFLRSEMQIESRIIELVGNEVPPSPRPAS
ncbi:MAG TPA: hypothetical protein VFP12_03725 [Allosphingosinicella sp.]|nr:hypothetical protein [Allosphingosinicella sp.]